MKILSIGNSFSQDAQRYLYEVAANDGYPMKTVNLFIGGCNLRMHYINMLEDRAAYDFEFNGKNTGIKVSIKEALISDEWDYVTIQQASPYSVRYESFTPYISELAAYVRKYCPHAKLLIHETWSYENGCERLLKLGFSDTHDMLDVVRHSYKLAALEIGAHGIIPSGEAMAAAMDMGIEKIHRDTFHAGYGAGRYLLALLWYAYLTGRDISENSFSRFDVPTTDEEIRIVKAAVKATLEKGNL